MKRDERSLPLFRMICLVAVFVFGVMAIVGSSSKGGGNTTSAATPTISGTVATGAPVVTGRVYIKDKNGKTVSIAIQSNGYYEAFDELTPPLFFYAEGTNADGVTVKLYAAGVRSTGYYNITPESDLVARVVTDGDPETIFNRNLEDWDIDLGDIANAQATVIQLLTPVYEAVGCYNPLSNEKLAIGSTCDLALDYLDFQYEEDVVMITNDLTGETIEVDKDGNSAGFQVEIPEDMADKAETMRLFIEDLEALYATEPSETQLDAFFEKWVADDFFEDGETKEELKNRWLLRDEGPSIGWKFISFSIGEEVSGTGYAEAYQIVLWSKSGTSRYRHETVTVFNGEKWLWYGNHQWIDCDIQCHAVMNVSVEGNAVFYSQLDLHFGDELNYAYLQKGVRSAIVTGPGLPDVGVVLQHRYPENFLEVYHNEGNTSGYYNLTQDAINQIEGDSVYTIRLYAAEAGDVSLADTALVSYTYQLGGRPPHSLSDLTQAQFPTLVSPTSHNLTAANIPGQLTVTWNNPSSELWDASWVDLTAVIDGGFYSLEREFLPGSTTTASFDTSGWVQDVTHAYIYIWGRDNFDRTYNYIWNMNDYGQ